MKYDPLQVSDGWQDEATTFSTSTDCPRWFPVLMIAVVACYSLLFVLLVGYLF